MSLRHQSSSGGEAGFENTKKQNRDGEECRKWEDIQVWRETETWAEKKLLLEVTGEEIGQREEE